MPSRRRSRESALQMIYQWEMSGGTPAQVVTAYFGGLGEDGPSPVDPFAERLFLDVSQDAERLDAVIRQFAKGWTLERIAPVVRHLLRLGISEIRSGMPAGVVINEAVEIARRFAGDEATSFVNGILDAVSKEVPRRARSEAGPAG